MSLQWTLVASFLYFEIAFIILIISPIISVPRWHKIFKSKFIKNLGAQSQIIFYTFLFILILLFIDSIKEMKKYSFGKVLDSEHGHLDSELQHSMKLFRAQRNNYIAGFALFLSIVIRRLIVLINDYALAIANQKASLKQAQNANEILENYLNSNKIQDNKKNSEKEIEIDDKLTKLHLEIAEYKEENMKLKKKNEAIRKQAQSVSDEYDRLCKEYENLNKELLKQKNQESNKKDD